MRQMRTVVSLVWIGVLIISLVLTGCSPGDLGPGDEIVIRSNTVVVDEETEDVLTTVTEEQDVLTFGASTPLLDEVKPGDVIIMGATDHTPNGLLRRVIDVTQDGEQVTVETEFATMEDVIEQGVVSVNATITAEDFEAAALGVDGIRVLESAEGIGFSIDLSRDFDELSITGELAFRANPIIRVEGTWWRARLDEMEFSIETDESLSIQIGTEASLIDVDKRIPLLPHPVTKIIPFQAGPLPVVMTISFMPVLIVKADLSGQMNVWVGYECQRKAGLHYLRGRDPSWVVIEEETTDFDGGAELYVQANLQAWVGPEVTVKFYDVVGPTGNVWGYLEFEARLDSQLQWDLHGGLQATLGVRAEFPVFGWEIGYGPVEVMHYRWLLAESSSEEEYDLTISSSSGGSVTTPGEGTFSRAAGTVVSLVASPASGYQFVNWTGDVGTIANVNAASTTITMNGNYSITANFAEEFDFSISATPSSWTARQNELFPITVRAWKTAGADTSVSFTVTGLPTGVSADPSNWTWTLGDRSRTMTFTVSPNAPVGTHTILITGTGGGVTRQIPFTLVVTGKFKPGDPVYVFGTDGLGLAVRDEPAGNRIGGKPDGATGVVLEGPVQRALGGTMYTWWKVRWDDDGLIGWSAENWLGLALG